MNNKEFKRRRRQLMRMMGKNCIAILPASSAKTRNRDVEYIFRQDSDFQYLTGFEEPEAVAVLVPGRAAGEYILFCRDRDPLRETWDGRRAGPEGAERDFGADSAFPIGDIDEILPGLMEGRDRVFYGMGRRPDFDTQIIAWVNGLRKQLPAPGQAPHELVSLEHLLHDMRLYKSRTEQAAMRRAARIAVDAHKRAMKVCRPGMMEYEVEAEFAHEFRRNGARTSYPPIVGGGENGCILHYTENNRVLNDGDLLLIDAGCEYHYYASDITRTFPVNGRFSSEQRQIYQVVLDAQLAAIEQVRAGRHFNEPHDAAVKVITRGLLKLGLLKGKLKALIDNGDYRRFYMHKTGHWLGMDVHDVGDYQVGGAWRELEPGMVLTVEPGIYIAPGSRGVPRKWWGIGVRIEDDVLVTRKDPDVLTRALPKEADQIEALMASG